MIFGGAEEGDFFFPTNWGSDLEPQNLPNHTPPKFNMESENDGFQEEPPISRDFFSGSMLNFGGVIFVLLFWLVFRMSVFF